MKFQRLFITGVILFAYSSLNAQVIEKSSDHRLIVNDGGKVIYQDINRINGKEVYINNWEKSSDAEARYIAKKINEARVQHGSSGALSSVTVPVTQKAEVPKKTVLKNLLGKAIAGGRIVAGAGSGPIGWAITGATVAHTAYNLVAPTLADNGYVWDSNAQNFVTDKEYKYCLINDFYDGKGWVEVDCVGLGKISYELDQKGEVHLRPIRDSLCRRNWQKILPQYKPEYGYRFGYSLHVAGCTAVSDTDNGRTAGNFRWYKVSDQAISQSEFDRIIGPVADSSPTRYVNATANDDGTIPGVTTSPDVTVPSGTVVTIGPYTDTDGQPKQVTVTFNTANGQTTATVTVTSRPDLTPNSPTAPSSSSGSSSNPGSSSSPGSSSNPANAPNPDGSSETGGDTRTENIPKKDTDSNDEPSDNPDEKTDDKPKEQQDGGLLCELFPDILACAKMGEVAEDEPFKIPHITNETAFSPDFFLPDTGTCPAPETVSIMGQQYSFTYEWLCRFAEMIRFIVIGIASISAAYIMFSGLRKD
ncbi:IgG-binding virulence factor TspB family protein [Neisseria sp.]|uniref:IgG-binding virulence factor TspB family protein n=1 Tax=Neisseria sp. TaxID=192066 RepID=UPI0026DDC10C|nr:IgG-binding virulence factor TspB family protein [Neisseria sp.]MDO4227548.1 IgG-binding virulence factor TspB family protein [Neisseria sp.]